MNTACFNLTKNTEIFATYRSLLDGRDCTYYFLYIEFSDFYVNQSLAGQTLPTHNVKLYDIHGVLYRTSAVKCHKM
jgi:hypothetical protein